MVFGSYTSVTASWNAESFSMNLTDQLFYNFVQEVEAITENNVLCFSGAAFFPTIALGPVVDNVTLTALRPSGNNTNSTTENNQNSQS